LKQFAADKSLEQFVKRQNDGIAADQQVVDDLGDRIRHWIDEASMLQDIASNCERVGIATEASNVARARKLFEEVEGWNTKLSEAPTSGDVKAGCERRILKAAVAAILIEARGAAKSLKA
jgi:hypothetical protein